MPQILFTLVQGLHTTLDFKENLSRSVTQSRADLVKSAAFHRNMSSFYGLVGIINQGQLQEWTEHCHTAILGMDGTLPHSNFGNLKPVEISKNLFSII